MAYQVPSLAVEIQILRQIGFVPSSHFAAELSHFHGKVNRLSAMAFPLFHSQERKEDCVSEQDIHRMKRWKLHLLFLLVALIYGVLHSIPHTSGTSLPQTL